MKKDIVKKPPQLIEMTINDDRIVIDGEIDYLSAPPFEQRGEIYLPYSEICRLLLLDIRRENNKLIVRR
ncbi:MAG: hypothetical protein KA467_00045 [Bacteroidales bacterium]|nr:hypothetical protein [Bacteroidales bacterium]